MLSGKVKGKPTFSFIIACFSKMSSILSKKPYYRCSEK